MQTYTREFFVESGRKGGKKTLKKWGKKHLLALASKGGKAVRKKKGKTAIDRATP